MTEIQKVQPRTHIELMRELNRLMAIIFQDPEKEDKKKEGAG